jgi:hypothetical protein
MRTIDAASLISVIVMIGYVDEAELSGLVSDLSGRYMHKIVHGHGHVQKDQVKFCPCTCAHMHKTDLLMAPMKRHAHYFVKAKPTNSGNASHSLLHEWTPMRCDSSTELFLLLYIAFNSSAHCTKNRSHVHNSAPYHSLKYLN